MNQPKPVNMKFNIPGGKDLAFRKLRLDRNSGTVTFLDANDNPISVEGVTRVVEHQRSAKHPKVRTRTQNTGAVMSFNGAQELTEFHDVHVIDTSYDKLPRKDRVAVAASIRLQFMQERAGVRATSDGTATFYELRDFHGNPELFAIACLLHDCSWPMPPGIRRAVVTDTELGLLEAMNARSTPLYGAWSLPSGFILQYASADTGQEVLNRLLKDCDREAKRALRAVDGCDVAPPKCWKILQGLPGKYRTFTHEIALDNDLIGPSMLNNDAVLKIYGVRSDADL